MLDTYSQKMSNVCRSGVELCLSRVNKLTYKGKGQTLTVAVQRCKKCCSFLTGGGQLW